MFGHVAIEIRAGEIDEGGRWRYEFLPSENLGSGIHLAMKRHWLKNNLTELGQRYQAPFHPI